MDPFHPASVKSRSTAFPGDFLQGDKACSQYPAKISLPPYSKVSNADANRRCNVNAEEIQVGRDTAPTGAASNSPKRSIKVSTGSGNAGKNSLSDNSAKGSEVQAVLQIKLSDSCGDHVDKFETKNKYSREHLKSLLTKSSAGKCVPRKPLKAEPSTITANTADKHNFAVSWAYKKKRAKHDFNFKMCEFSASSFAVSNMFETTPKTPEKSLTDSSVLKSATPNVTTNPASPLLANRTDSGYLTAEVDQSKQNARAPSDAEIEQIEKKLESLILDDISHFTQNDHKLLPNIMHDTFITALIEDRIKTATGILAAAKKLNVELPLSQPSIQSILSTYSPSPSPFTSAKQPLSEFKLLVGQLIDHKIDVETIVLEVLYNSLMPHKIFSKDMNLNCISEFADFAQSISSLDIGVWMKDLILAHVDYTLQSFDDFDFCATFDYFDLYLEHAKSLNIKLDDLAKRDTAAIIQDLFDWEIEESYFAKAVSFVEMDRKWNFGLVIPDYPTQIKEVLEDCFHQQLSESLEKLLSQDIPYRSLHVGNTLNLIQTGIYLKISFRQDVKELARCLLHSSSGSEGYPKYLKIALMIGVHDSEYLQG